MSKVVSVGGKRDPMRYKFGMSKNCHRSKAKQKAFLDWLKKQPRYREEKPPLKKFISDALTPGTNLYKAKILPHSQKEAAEAHYKREGQYYFSHVTVVRVNIKTKRVSPPVRAYIPIKYSKNGEIKEYDYMSARRVYEDHTAAMGIVERARRDFEAWIARYERYAEFMQVFSPVIDEYRKTKK